MLEHIHFLGGPPPQVHLMRSGWSSVCQSVVVIESEVAEFLWAMVYSAFILYISTIMQISRKSNQQ